MSADDNLGEQFFHLTSRAKFRLDPTKVPTDNSITLSRLLSEPRRGLYLTKEPHHWVNRYNYVRPYVAEIHVPAHHVESGEYGGEGFLPAEHFPHATVSRVIPLDAHVREEFGEHGWIEEHHDTEFDTGNPIRHRAFNEPHVLPHKDYRYPGPDVRDMPKEQTQIHARRARALLKHRLR